MELDFSEPEHLTYRDNFKFGSISSLKQISPVKEDKLSKVGLTGELKKKSKKAIKKVTDGVNSGT